MKNSTAREYRERKLSLYPRRITGYKAFCNFWAVLLTLIFAANFLGAASASPQRLLLGIFYLVMTAIGIVTVFLSRDADASAWISMFSLLTGYAGLQLYSLALTLVQLAMPSASAQTTPGLSLPALGAASGFVLFFSILGYALVVAFCAFYFSMLFTHKAFFFSSPAQLRAALEAAAPHTAAQVSAPVPAAPAAPAAAPAPPAADARAQYLCEWNEALSTLPRAAVGTDGQPQALREISALDDLRFALPTKRSRFADYGNFVVIDTETTGLHPLTDDLLEVSAIRVENWQPKEIYTTLVSPAGTLHADAAAVNGITAEMLAGAPTIWQIMPSLQTFIGSSPLLGHNLTFDLQFLCARGLDVLSTKRRFYDSHDLARHVLRRAASIDAEPETYDVENYKLSTLCRWYGIPRMEAHRALGDCVDTAGVFGQLVRDRIGIK